MSESTKAMSKPKRPLSGYNLFYRYKRNKILEATSRPNGNNNDREDKAVIHAILATVPGLEGVPPDSPVLHLPPAQLNEFRAAAIRGAMEGKIFPNENARKRVHSKFLGMGFVEMGKTMRDMWAQADKFTKDLFCDLADVGRVRYRRLMADYNENKLVGERPENIQSEAANEANTSVVPVVHEYRTTATAVDPTRTAAAAKAKAAVPSFTPHPAPSSSDPMLEALSAVLATRNPPPPDAPTAFVPRQAPSSSYHMLEAQRDRWNSLLTDLQRRCDDADGEGPPTESEDGPDNLRFRAPVPHQAQPVAGDWDWIVPRSFDATTSPAAEAAPADAKTGFRPSRGRRVSSTAAKIDLRGDSLFKPLPVEGETGRVATATFNPTSGPAPVDAGKGDRPSRGRRVSAVAAELDLCDVSLFEPLSVDGADGPVAASSLWPAPVETNDRSATPKTGYIHERRVSTDISALPDNGSGSKGDITNAPAAVMMGNGSAGSHSDNAHQEGPNANLEQQQIFLRNAIQNIKDRIIRNNLLLPSDMRVFPKEDVIPQGNIVGKKSYLEMMTSSGPQTPSSNCREKGEVSAQDFMEFIGELDEAIDDRDIAVSVIKEPEGIAAFGATGGRGGRGPSFVFGEPLFDTHGPDFGDKPAPRPQTTVPMPAVIHLKNQGARMA